MVACKWALVVTAMALFASASAMAQQQSTAKAIDLVKSDRVLVIGHRGASAYAPENTLPAFREALKSKPDLVELDYYHSADGVPFTFHDKTLDRTTNASQVLGKRKLGCEKVTWKQLATLDAGRWFDPRFAGTRIPTLAESIDTIQAGSTTLIERKGGDAATVVELLADKQLIDSVVVQAFDWDYLRECHRLAPELALGALGSKSLGAKQLAEIKATGAAAVGWKHSDIGRGEVQRVHAAGLKLWVYTVNDPADMKRLITLGVDGLITDKPDVARKVVSAR